MWTSLLLCLIGLTNSVGAKEVCYSQLGCFNNDPPFDNALGLLPKSPNDLPVTIWLYTRRDRDTHKEIKYDDPAVVDKFKAAGGNVNNDIKVIVHGFGGAVTDGWMRDTKDALLDKADLNVLLYGWEEGAEIPNYFQAVANLRLAAAQAGILLEKLRDGGVDLAKVHLIGHSLGAHLAGAVGRRLSGAVGQITGLDPSEPAFENFSTDVRLDKTDAIFVDVIHTNGDELNIFTSGLGLYQPSGDVDFYVNGGKKQPGCYDGISGFFGTFFGWKRNLIGRLMNNMSCSHQRVVFLYLESIRSPCAFTAYPCDSYSKFKSGQCGDCSNNGCNQMGFNADPAGGKGNLYLQTTSTAPYC